MDAIRLRWNLGQDKPLPEEYCCFRTCGVCRQISTRTQSSATIGLKSTEGLWKAQSDIGKLEAYCSWARVFAHEQCGNAPLLRVLGLGRITTWKRQAITICCECGRWMQCEPDYISFTPKGIACIQCTRKAQQARDQDMDSKNMPVIGTRCAACWKPISTNKMWFYFWGRAVVMCHRHRRDMDAYVEEVSLKKLQTQKEVEEAIVAVHKRLKSQREVKARPKHNRQLKQARRNAASKPARHH